MYTKTNLFVAMQFYVWSRHRINLLLRAMSLAKLTDLHEKHIKMPLNKSDDLHWCLRR